MRTKNRVISILLLIIVALMIAGAGVVWAERSHRTAGLPHSVMDSGGTGGSAGVYELRSSLGQPVAGQGTAGSYELESGFWSRVGDIIAEFLNFLPLFER